MRSSALPLTAATAPGKQRRVLGLLHGLEDERGVGRGVARRELRKLPEIAGVGDHGGVWRSWSSWFIVCRQVGSEPSRQHCAAAGLGGVARCARMARALTRRRNSCIILAVTKLHRL